MHNRKVLLVLSLLVALLAAFYAGVGLFSRGGDGPFTFMTLHGKEVEIYGQGIYHNDSSFKAPILRGTDAVTLFVCVPLLLAAVLLDQRGPLRFRLRGRLFLTSMLSYFVYNAASLALGAAYNNLLIVYIATFSASLFGFVLGLRSIDLPTLAEQTSARLPRRGIAVFLFLAGMSLVVWVVDMLVALAGNTVPANLAHYSTEATYLLDVGIILPSAYLAGVLVWRRQALGTLLALVLMTLNATIGPVVASQSVMQALDGIVLTPGEYAAYVAPFVTLSVIAIGLLVSIYRNISETGADRKVRTKHSPALLH